MRVADFILNRLHSKYGVRHIPLITGNGALVLNDALSKVRDKITPICVLHEQDAGYFALGYSKYTNKLSVVNPTTGCAGTNCITPLLDAYQDHVPILFLSGNVALKQTTRYQKLHNKINLKKLGPQEVDIIEIVKSITKYAAMVGSTDMVQYELDKCIDIALTPPFGPVWLDLPADIGSAKIEENQLFQYFPIKNTIKTSNFDEVSYIKDFIVDCLNKYSRPIVLAGNGIRLSNTVNELKLFIEKYNIPCVVTFGGIDLLNYYHPLYLGGPIGVKPCRASNYAIQKSDFIISLGCCLNTPQIGYMGEKFAPDAYKVVIDINEENHKKNNVKIDKMINCNLVDFFRQTL